MNFIRNLNLKDREIKMIYILIVLFVVFIVFRLLSAFLPQTAFAKQELEEMQIEKNNILFILYEIQELNARNELLELELRSLKDKFILESENVRDFMAYGYGDGILIKSIVPRDMFDNGYYYTNAYLLNVEGMYQDIINFISRLEKSPASRIVEIDISLNAVDMNVQGSIVWEIYSLHGRGTSIVSASIQDEHGRSDPFQVPQEYIVFLDELIYGEEPDEIDKENQNANEIETVRENTLEAEITREGIVEIILETVENILEDADRVSNNRIEFLHEYIYSFPIKRESSFY